jgi:diadenosine tetraphosphate (Ap4A) HIT family hydrolase
MSAGCPFCERVDEIFGNDLCYAIRDRYPVSRGHTLVIPRRHYADVFESTEAELASFAGMIARVRRSLDAEFSPQGYNVGVNCGNAAGQTIMHAHIHVIPRYRDDRFDPTGGVRGVIPGRGRYP